MDLQVEWLRDLPVTPDGQLSEVSPGIFMSEGGVPEHIDKIGDGNLVYGLVLLNDAGLQLQIDNHRYGLEVGSVYIINGLKPHSTYPDFPTPGQRFAVLVEYAPPGTWTAAEYKAHALQKLEFVNVCAIKS